MSSPSDRHAAEHALAIAALQAGDLAGPELARAEDLRKSCPACAALYADLGTLRSAVRALPPSPRRRDYRLTEADAARLQPTGWRRFVGWLAAPRSSVRPLATSLATLGLAGLLLTSIPGLTLFGSAAATSAPAYLVTMGPADAELATGAPAEPPQPGTVAAPTRAPAASAAPANAPEGPAAEPSPGGQVAGAGQEGSSATRSAAPDESSRNAAGKGQLADQEPSGPSLVALASVVLLIAGLGLFAGRWAARRARV
jgi:hypothetical protein